MKNEAYEISMNDVQWLLEYCQVCIVNYQNTTRALLQLIVAHDVHEQVQADHINMCAKFDCFHV